MQVSLRDRLRGTVLAAMRAAKRENDVKAAVRAGVQDFEGRQSFLQDTILHSHNSTHTTQHGTSLYGHNSTPHNFKHPQIDTAQLNTPQLDTPQFDTSQLDTPQLYTGHMAVWLKLLYSSERYEQSVNVITLRQKSRIRTIPLFGPFVTL